MIGYRGRYEWVGKPAARLDDLLNLVPARLTALLIALGSERPARALAIARRDHGQTASPNAGWPMSAMAGALGVRLTKPGAYCLGAELADPDVTAIHRSIDVLAAATLLSVPVALLLATWTRSRR